MSIKKFGLIGKTLKHSYSKIIHSELGDYPYELYELEEEQLEGFIGSDIDGFNVTIPYKKAVMKYLDVIDESAKRIGSVNTVIKRNGKIYGYNTDFYGMLYMLREANITLLDKKVMILGTGGTGNTAKAVAEFEKAREIVIVSRSGEVNYQNYKEHKDTQIIINTTPVGMYPNVLASPIDLSCFDKLEGVADVIYNPDKTVFTLSAEQRNIKAVNGLSMLVAQAKQAMELFLDVKADDEIIENTVKKLRRERRNLVLIGMPGCGKSTIGKAVASRLGKDFIDTDEEIVKREGRSIPEIFETDGEDYFRKIESEVLRDVCNGGDRVIATGGGIVKREENGLPMRLNGVVCWIRRPISKLATEGRPLSLNEQALIKIYDERKEKYHKFSDAVVDNASDIEIAIKEVIDIL